MAINKVVNKSTKSHGAMRNVLEYVLRDEKVKEGYVFIEGPYAGDSINYDEVYQTWIREKQIWDKDSGRMYAHNIISFHKDEKVTPEDVLEIGKAYAEKFFPGYQYVISVHQDKDHLHCHIVVNSVSYIDGHKLHQTKKDLEKQKEFTNDLCRDRGLSVAEKGHHFDGSLIEQGEITAWSKDKYNLLINNTKQSFVADCAIALMEVIPHSANRDEFISGMKARGWSVQWEEKRKHIVFQNENGNKVRDSNIEKTFAGMEVNKEALTHEFERQNEHRISERRSDTELSQYYDELESAVAGLDIAKTVRDNSEAGRRDTELVQNSIRPAVTTGSGNAGMGAPKGPGQTGRHRDDTETLIADIRADISNSQSQSRAVVRAENQSLADEEQRRLEEQCRAAIEERAREARRRAHHHSGPSL